MVVASLRRSEEQWCITYCLTMPCSLMMKVLKQDASQPVLKLFVLDIDRMDSRNKR